MEIKVPKKASREAVGERLRAWRKGQGLNLVPLAEIIGVSQGCLSDIENGKTYPQYTTIYRLICAFPEQDIVGILFKL